MSLLEAVVLPDRLNNANILQIAQASLQDAPAYVSSILRIPITQCPRPEDFQITVVDKNRNVKEIESQIANDPFQYPFPALTLLDLQNVKRSGVVLQDTSGSLKAWAATTVSQDPIYPKPIRIYRDLLESFYAEIKDLSPELRNNLIDYRIRHAVWHEYIHHLFEKRASVPAKLKAQLLRAASTYYDLYLTTLPDEPRLSWSVLTQSGVLDRTKLYDVVSQINPKPNNGLMYHANPDESIVGYISTNHPIQQNMNVAPYGSNISECIVENMALKLLMNYLSQYRPQFRQAVEGYFNVSNKPLFESIFLFFGNSPQRLAAAMCNGSFYEHIASLIDDNDLYVFAQCMSDYNLDEYLQKRIPNYKSPQEQLKRIAGRSRLKKR